MNLSPHFTLAEFCRSDTADRLGIDNDLPASLLPAAKVTAAMLERIRDHLSAKAGKPVPIIISSGYRNPATNKAVGSGPTSDHLDAAAADWKAPAFGTPTEVCRELAPLVGVLGIGQIINEFPSPNGGWVHTSTRVPTKAINRIITITRRGVTVGVSEG